MNDVNDETAIVTPNALAQALGRTPEISLTPTVLFNFLNQPAPQSIGNTMATKDSFFGAFAARFGDELTVLSNLGIGSAALAFYFEMALEFGARNFVFLGQAGAIAVENNAVENNATDETESTHEIGELVTPTTALAAPSLVAQYLQDPHEYQLVKQPAHDLSDKFCESLSKNIGAPLKTGIVWSTDAIFRETPKPLSHAYAQGARLVDMETAVLFTLGNHFKVPTVAVLVVTDVLKIGACPAWQAHFRETAEARQKLLHHTCAALLR